MYRNAYQRGMLTVFFSVGSKPLNMWDVHLKNGYITRMLDEDIKSTVYEIGSTNVSTTYITCPKGNSVLGITMPFLVMIVKNQKKYFTFEVTILDDTGTRRRFRVSNFQSTTQILPLCTVMPIGLSEGWNQIQFNLAEFTRRAYKKHFIEVQKLKINANIRLRRIYFADRLISEDELPPEYKLFFPLSSKNAKAKMTKTGVEDKMNTLTAPPKDEPPKDAPPAVPPPIDATPQDAALIDAPPTDAPPTDAPPEESKPQEVTSSETRVKRESMASKHSTQSKQTSTDKIKEGSENKVLSGSKHASVVSMPPVIEGAVEGESEAPVVEEVFEPTEEPLTDTEEVLQSEGQPVTPNTESEPAPNE